MRRYADVPLTALYLDSKEMNMKKTLGILGACCVALVFVSSCASIVKGTNSPISISTSPEKAKVIIESLDGTQYEEKEAPCTFNLSTAKDYTVRIRLEGYQNRDMTLNRKLTGWLWGNIVFGGIIGLAVDFGTGAAWEHEKSINVNLEPKGHAGFPEKAYITLVKQDRSTERLEVPIRWELAK